MDKPILDVCCGGKMFWFDKDREDVVFMDCREASYDFGENRKFQISPDVIGDFRVIPFDDETFELVVFDPPHLTRGGDNSWMVKKYGKLDPERWEEDIREGFEECFRVLKDKGILVFKWNEYQKSVRQVLDAVPFEPLFGHPTGRSGKTKWMLFRKTQEQ